MDKPVELRDRIKQRIDIIRQQDAYSKQVGHASQLGFLVEQHGEIILASLSRPESEHLSTPADALREAAQDALAGWRYIRQQHGDLYGVGWDRVEQALDAALQSSQPPTSPETYASWQQKRGYLADKVDWAILEYDEFMKDDAYDSQRVLDRIIEGLRQARDVLKAGES